jgi:biopolymer transport protein ExbB
MLKSIVRTLSVSLAAMMLLAPATSAAPASSQAQPMKTFFSQFVVAGGPIVWFILIPMSIAAIALIIEHSLVIRRKILLPEGSGRKIAMLLGTRNLAELPHALSRRSDLLSLAIISAIAHTGGARMAIRPRDLIVESLQERAFQLMRKIEWLNILGNVSPMVGLFGTVVGTITSLDALSQSGGLASPSKLAGGISVALVTTYWGLLVAIPALTAHGLFRNRIEAIASEAALEAETLIPHLARLMEPQQAVPQGPYPAGAGETRPAPGSDTVAETAP